MASSCSQFFSLYTFRVRAFGLRLHITYLSETDYFVEFARKCQTTAGVVWCCFLKKRSWRLSTTRTLRLIVWERCFYPRDACSEVSVARSTSTAARQFRWTNVARRTFECAINRHKKVTSELESLPNLFYRETNASADTFNDVLHFFRLSSLSLSLRFFFRHLFLNLFTIHCCRRLKSTIYTNFVFFIFMHSFFSPSVSIAAYICFFFVHAAAYTTFKCREKSKRDS